MHVILRISVLILLAATAVSTARAQEEYSGLGSRDDGILALNPGEEEPHLPWRRIDGRKVVVEGIFEEQEKGNCVVVVRGAEISIVLSDGPGSCDCEDGALVRAVGVFKRDVTLPSKPGQPLSQWSGPGVRYTLIATSAKRISRVRWLGVKVALMGAEQDDFPLVVSEFGAEKPQTWWDAVDRRVVVEGAVRFMDGKAEKEGVAVVMNAQEERKDAGGRALLLKTPRDGWGQWKEGRPIQVEGVLRRFVAAPLVKGVPPQYGAGFQPGVNYYLEATRREYIAEAKRPGVRLAAERLPPPQAPQQGAPAAIQTWNRATSR